ncbi:MAG: AAA family ATPase, partial [Eubacteriales bacterium]
YITERDPDKVNVFNGLEDYDRWKKTADLRKKRLTQSAYIRSQLMNNVQERSNGESALAFFVETVKDNALYLLDEPENSLSPQNQLELKYFIEDSVRSHGCQFIISTHSPFLLSLRRARIYDIDIAPPMITPWTELESIRVYHDFFKEHDEDFDE